MKITKKKAIIGCLILAALVFTFWWGGNAPGLRGFNVAKLTEKAQTEAKANAQKAEERDAADEKALKADKKDKNDKEEKEEAEAKKLEEQKAEEDKKTEEDKKAEEAKDKRPENPDGKPMTAAEKLAEARQIAKEQGVKAVPKGDKAYSESQGMVINPKTGKDKYLTDPVPAGKPLPVEPGTYEITDKKSTCTLSIRCDTINDNIKWLDKEKVELVPKDGVILSNRTVTFYEGESVFNLLLRECKANRVHMEFVDTPIYNSAYIEGIHNLYEFDCGELSGWMYKVNGWFPNYGCSRYLLKPGDKVEWVYTCNLGIDVGGYFME